MITRKMVRMMIWKKGIRIKIGIGLDVGNLLTSKMEILTNGF